MSPSLDGFGRGDRRRSARVTRVTFVLLRGDFGIRARRYRSACFFEWRDEVEELEAKLAFGSCGWIVNVGSDRTVGDFVLAVDSQDLLFGHVLEQVAHAEDDYGMPHQKNALAAVFTRNHFRCAAKAQNHVAPALSPRRTVVEFAEEAAVFGLVGVIGIDADLGEAVENAEFLFAQPLIDDHAILVA